MVVMRSFKQIDGLGSMVYRLDQFETKTRLVHSSSIIFAHATDECSNTWLGSFGEKGKHRLGVISQKGRYPLRGWMKDLHLEESGPQSFRTIAKRRIA